MTKIPRLLAYLPQMLKLLFCISLWLVIFTLGVFVDTTKIRMGLTASGTISAYNFFLLISCWTWSNVVFLCCLSAIIGELGRAVQKSTSPNFRMAVVKGFFVYLLALTGQLIISGTVATPVAYTPTLQGQPMTDNPAALGQAAYFRLASFVSFLSFLVGYSPKLFGEIFKKLEHAVEGEIGSEENACSRPKDTDEVR